MNKWNSQQTRSAAGKHKNADSLVFPVGDAVVSGSVGIVAGNSEYAKLPDVITKPDADTTSAEVKEAIQKLEEGAIKPAVEPTNTSSIPNEGKPYAPTALAPAASTIFTKKNIIIGLIVVVAAVIIWKGKVILKAIK